MKDHERFSGIAKVTLPFIVGLPNLAAAALPQNIADVAGKLCLAYKWIYTGAIIFGVIFVIVAAFKYLTAAGQSEKVSAAHKALTYAVIGIAVAIVSAGVPTIVSTFLGGGAVNPITGNCN